MTTSRRADGYDVIGDIHGHADKLVLLLQKMGYEKTAAGVWGHPARTALFVGDLIDRGPDQVKTVDIVRAMVDAGTAEVVLGNHEFNAVAWHTRDPDDPSEYLRRHTDKNHSQHDAFLSEVSEWSERHTSIIEWFKTLPLWLERDGLRVVHACWDSRAIDDIRGIVTSNNSLTPELVVAASQKGSPEHRAIEHLLKGPEIRLDVPYLDGDGHERRDARFRWWLPYADRLKAAALIPHGAKTVGGENYPELPDILIEPPVLPYPHDEKPVFYGHYWRAGTPTISSDQTACVDYSAGRGGPLVAYRWSGESPLVNDNFVSSKDP